MYTKSIIQQTVEALKVKDNFRAGIQSLMDKYIIEDSVFVLKNGFVHEVVNGYFAVENEYDSLQEAISACNIANMGIRVMNSEKFQTGKLHQNLVECEEGKKVFDLSRLEDVR